MLQQSMPRTVPLFETRLLVGDLEKLLKTELTLNDSCILTSVIGRSPGRRFLTLRTHIAVGVPLIGDRAWEIEGALSLTLRA